MASAHALGPVGPARGDYIRKGDRLFVEGRMEYDSYERNGENIPTAEITVRDVVLLGSPRRESAEVESEEEEEEEPF